MGWYANQKARNEAKKAGEARPVTGGLGDRVSEALEAKVEASKEREQRARDRVTAAQDVHDAAKGAKATRKRERKAARKGL